MRIRPFRIKRVELPVLGFWFIALFPGRIGYDNVLALNTIRSGESTDWWTPQYFWLLKITSINGNAIWLTALMSLSIGFYSVNQLVRSIELDPRKGDRALLLLSIIPLAPVFFLTISHDAFFTSGFILLTSYLIRMSNRKYSSHGNTRVNFIIAEMLLVTTYAGQIIFALGIIIFILFNRNRISYLIVLAITCSAALGTLGVAHEIPTKKYLWPVIADIKCIVQHPTSILSVDTWITLEKLAPREKWMQSISCKRMDDAVSIINPKILEESSDKELLRLFVNLAINNPQIVIMSHLQKNRGLLPPPFFQPPENMISWDSNKPVGEGLDSSLQTQAEVLHSSIDSDAYRPKYLLLKPMEALALLPVFILNQASWFWGWAGLWFIFCLPIFGRHSTKVGSYLFLAPTILLTSILLITSPESSARYSMPITILGLTFCSVTLIKWAKNREKP